MTQWFLWKYFFTFDKILHKIELTNSIKGVVRMKTNHYRIFFMLFFIAIILIGCSSAKPAAVPVSTVKAASTPTVNAVSASTAATAAAPSPSPSPAPAASLAPAPSNKTVPQTQQATNTIKPQTTAAAEPKKESVQIISVTSPAARNSTATLKAKVTPGSTASITIHYKSGPSKAAGLESKKADANGNVSWSWHVGGNTTLGTWPITVNSNGASAETSFQVIH
jgi:hypothetical protein